MTISSWAQEFCSQSGELLLLFQPQDKFLCLSPSLVKAVAHHKPSIEDYFLSLPINDCARPDFNPFSLYVKNITCIDGLYCYQLSPMKASEQSWEIFAKTMGKIHEIMIKLSQAVSVDELYQRAILEAQQHLFIDRMGILLLDKKNNQMIGTWGIDQDGQLKDETGFRSPIPDSPWVELTLASKEHVEVWDNVDLLYYDKVVGKGWNAMAALWDGEEVIGWIACDNLLNKRPIQPWLKEIIGQFGQALGHAIVRFNNIEAQKNINDHLEFMVEQRSKELNEKIELLEQTKSELVESEKLASLGGLVAGVAHEVNTPIGIGVTAASHLLSLANEISHDYQDKSMTKTQLEGFFFNAKESSEIILNNLERASELVKSFKQLAVEQSFDVATNVNLFELVENIRKSFGHQFKNKPIEFQNLIDIDLNYFGHSGNLNQIITNLVNNSLVHGFEKNNAGIIKVSARREGSDIHLCYCDTGSGVKTEHLEKLLEPFFTTKRGSGGTGLGLNIIYNIISKLGGQIELSQVNPHGLQLDITLPIEGD